MSTTPDEMSSTSMESCSCSAEVMYGMAGGNLCCRVGKVWDMGEIGICWSEGILREVRLGCGVKEEGVVAGKSGRVMCSCAIFS